MLNNIKVVYIAGFLIMTAFGAFYYQDILFKSSPPAVVSSQTNDSVVQTVERRYNIEGMFCDSCKQKIETAVSELPGVINVNVNTESKEMLITYQTEKENIQQTLETIKGLGYTAGLKSSSGKLQVLDFNVTFQ